MLQKPIKLFNRVINFAETRKIDYTQRHRPGSFLQGGTCRTGTVGDHLGWLAGQRAPRGEVGMDAREGRVRRTFVFPALIITAMLSDVPGACTCGVSVRSFVENPCMLSGRGLGNGIWSKTLNRSG